MLRHLLKEVKDEHNALKEQQVNKTSLEPQVYHYTTCTVTENVVNAKTKNVHDCFN